MSEKLLSEYQCVLRELEMIKNRAAVIKDVTQDRLKCAKNEEEKENIFIDFKTQLHKIKKDKNIKRKYKNLIKQKEIIETEIRGKMSEEQKPKHNIPLAKNTKQKKNIQKISSSESNDEKCEILENIVDVKSNINDDITNLINKYQKNIKLDEPSPVKHKMSKQKRHKKKKVYSSNSESSDDNNRTIIVNVPNNRNDNGGCYQNSSNCNINTKNPYVSSPEEFSDEDNSKIKTTKYCLSDTQQVKKLYNLIKDLQGEIDR